MMQTRINSPSGPRVLVVEDEALIAEEIHERLNRLNYQVVGIADTGHGAIEAAMQICPDLVLMDIRIKGPLDGIETAKQIYRNLEIPTVYLTAHSDQATFQRAASTAPFGYVIKPFQERDLLIAIEIALQRRRLEQLLKESHLTYDTIINSIADGVIATDTEGRVCFMNPVAETLTGWRLAEAQGVLVQQVLVVVENPVAQALCKSAAVGLPRPYWLTNRAGRAVPIEGSASAIVDVAGTVTGAVMVFRDITQRRQFEEQIKQQVEMLNEKSMRLEALATTDGLTGLKNHRALQERLTEECRRAQRYKIPLSLILLDVDRFKQFNDTFGHPAGDAALKQVARILLSCGRQTDITARYGGEEFAVLLTETDHKGAMAAARRIRTAIENANWELRPLTVSLGVATFGESGIDASTLIEAADRALYHSKLSGRNLVTHIAEVPVTDGEMLRGDVSMPYTDLICEMLTIQRDTLFSASEQIREVMAQAYDATVISWSRLLDLKDKETEGHSERVTELTVRLAKRIGMNAEEILYARWGALLHDIGKMGVPDHILHKPGPLTEEEWAVMQRHTTIAQELLAPVSFLRPALSIPYCHHEKWDGTGYPQGLKGDDIPLAARLFAIVDVYDALTNDRPYRKAWTKEQTLAHIQSLQGTQFDPRAVKVFLSEVGDWDEHRTSE